VRAAPKEALLHYKLGNLLARRKRYEEALTSLRQAIEINPTNVNAYNELGNAYLELARPAEARNAYEAGLSHDPTAAKLHKNLARAALDEGHPEEAIHRLEKALSLYSSADLDGKAEAIYWLAAAQAAAGQASDACATLQKLAVLSSGLLSPFAKEATLLAEQERCTHGLD
jgi:tetratricopeptide (TPR) repeat protein